MDAWTQPAPSSRPLPGASAGHAAGGTAAGTPDGAAGEGSPVGAEQVEVIYESDRTRVTRIRKAGSLHDLIRKEPLGPGALEQTRHELRILQRLAGISGVVSLAPGAGPDEILLQEIRGRTLAEMLGDGVVDSQTCLAIALELARILGEVHEAGVVHADLNPTNILISGDSGGPDGDAGAPLAVARQPLLVDFHLATTFVEGVPGFAHHRQIAGTLPYLAPEQTGRTGMSVDERADLYGLGATLYELSTGEPPFTVGDPLRMVRDTLTRVPVPPAQRDARVPQQFSDIVMKLLEKEPERRYQSAAGLFRDLSRLREHLVTGRVDAFALGERDFPRRLSAPSRLIGRDDEILTLRTALDGALSGDGRGVLISGGPGVGKSRLVNELRSVVTGCGGWFVSGKFDQYRQDAESSALLQALRGLGRLLLSGSELELTAVRERIFAALGQNVTLLAAMPEFAALLGLGAQPVPALRSATDAHTMASRYRQVLLDLFHAVASPEHPIVIAIDDLQWASAMSVGFIDALLTDQRLTGVLLVGAYRDGEVSAAHPLTAALARWQQLGTPPAAIRLENLPDPDLGVLLGEMLRLPPAEAAELAAAVGARTSGNPYDTVELVNGLRRDGALVIGPTGWSWDTATIRRFVGQGNVVGLLAARITALPSAARRLLDIMACLAGEVELELLGAASGLSIAVLNQHLLAPLEDGLLIQVEGEHPAVRFRHDRVQQAAHGRLEPGRRRELHLVIARRLAAGQGRERLAAEQYLYFVDALAGDGRRLSALPDPAESRLAAGLFVETAQAVRVLNAAAADRFLDAADILLSLLTTAGEAGPDDVLHVRIERERHAVWYSLGRLEEADQVYAQIERRCEDPVDLVDPACHQIAGLANRGRSRDAVDLGLALLERLGIEVPDGDFPGRVAQLYDELPDWAAGLSVAGELDRPQTSDPRIRAAATLLNGLLAPSFFCSPEISSWLILTSRRLWAEHGASAHLVAVLSGAITTTILQRQDYRSGHRVAKHVLAIGQARGYEPETSYARHIAAHTSRHWFEPLEDDIQQSQLAREGLLRGGDLQMGCFTHFVSLAALLDCAPDLDAVASDAQAALAFAARTGNDHGTGSYLAYRQLLRALRGLTASAGSFEDADFDEVEHLSRLAGNPMAAAHFHIHRAMSAALFGDSPALIRHAAAAMPLLPYITGFYPVALAHLWQGLALAEQVRHEPPAGRGQLLAELDDIRCWLAARAADAPQNFLHLATLLDAERARAIGENWDAVRGFEDALSEVSGPQRPWHRALIAERAGLCHLTNGLTRTGRELLSKARRQYAVWGAAGKVAQLVAEHSFLQVQALDQPGTPPVPGNTVRPAGPSSGYVSARQLDMLAILRSSQALSSQTSLDGLRTRVGEVLSALSGATSVLIGLRPDDAEGWMIWDTVGRDQHGVPIAEAATLLPLSAFRYAERTGEPLQVFDAVHDERFSRDPYLADLERCSLMVVPLLQQGDLRGILLLENRLRVGAFAAEGLEAVLLVIGQLTVSLDNAQLYASLERKVQERTLALEKANRSLQVLSNTDALTGLANRRHFDATLEAELRRALRHGTPLSLAMIDVDRFKLYNDTYGHVAGDDCLRRVADALGSGRRTGVDLVCRYGGEEFAIILPGADQPGGMIAAERVRAAVAALHLPHCTPAGVVTVSIGVVSLVRGLTAPGELATVDDLVAAADLGLYRAKEKGRDQVRSGNAGAA